MTLLADELHLQRTILPPDTLLASRSSLHPDLMEEYLHEWHLEGVGDIRLLEDRDDNTHTVIDNRCHEPPQTLACW